MFESFFPKPRLFFTSFAAWSVACVVFWFALGRDAGESFSLGGWFGYGFPPESAEEADEASRAALAAGRESAGTFWFYQYMVLCYAVFLAFWYRYAPHRWARWSVFGSAAIIFVTWFQVQLDVMINEWFGTFYDLIQQALGEPNSVSAEDYFGQLLTFGQIALVANHGRGAHPLLRQPLHLPLAHRDERPLHVALGPGAPHRGRFAARAGGHHAVRRDHGASRGEPQSTR